MTEFYQRQKRAQMVIEQIRVYRFPLPAQTTYNMSSSTVSLPQSTIVELIDTSGMKGYGEACLATPKAQSASNDDVLAAMGVLAPSIIGLDPTDFSTVNAFMDASSAPLSEGKAALDIACWDLTGKKTNKSVVELLGGTQKDAVITYHVIGIASPEDAAEEALQLQESGITRIQLKAGGRPIEEDIACIHAVASVLLEQTTLDVDTNRGWTLNEAVKVSEACSSISMSMEQPCATEEELRHLKPLISHPLIIDESATDAETISNLMDDNVADGFGMKITRVGGLTSMKTIRDLCVEKNIPMSSDDAWGGDIIAAAGVALAATMPNNLNRGAWLAHPYHQAHYDLVNGPRIQNGQVALPKGGPGLGLLITDGFFGKPETIYE